MAESAKAEGKAEGKAGAKPEGKRGAKGLVVMAVLALAGGGGGFAATYTGLLDPLLKGGEKEEGPAALAASVAFVPIEPFMVSLGEDARARHLRFAAQLEVDPAKVDAVTEMKPRVVDALNVYLRAVEEEELEDPAAMARLRAQMMRRVEVVLGPDTVRDLLIMEFVLD